FTLSAEHVDSGAARFAPVSQVVLFPKFTRGKGDAYGGGDLALLQLSTKGYGNEPLAFYQPLDGNADLVSGSTAYLVGYGLNHDSPGGVRRSRHVKFQGREVAHLLDHLEVADGVFKFNRGDEGELPCGGDSGSPVLKFVSDRTGIIAIHS